MPTPSNPNPIASPPETVGDLRATASRRARETERGVAQPRGETDRRIAELEADLQALSHSIRSPLVALKGFTSLLEEEAHEQLSENGRHFLRRVSEAGRRIEWRLSDIGVLLSVSRSRIEPAWINLNHVLEDLSSELKELMESKGGRLFGPGDPSLIWCDRSQLRAALLHLVGNALQHAEPDTHPEIHVRVQRLEAATEISVADNGPGMEPELTARAFELFACTGNRAREFEEGRESTGLGLAVVRRIAEAHGGSARIESDLGDGVRVVLSLPPGG